MRAPTTNATTMTNTAPAGSPLIANPIENPSSANRMTITSVSRNEFRRFAEIWLWNVSATGPSASVPGRDQRQVVGPVGPLRFRSTTGVWDASGSASKNSRFVNPNGPAMKVFGTVAIEVL